MKRSQLEKGEGMEEIQKVGREKKRRDGENMGEKINIEVNTESRNGGKLKIWKKYRKTKKGMEEIQRAGREKTRKDEGME